ncbi:MAG: aminotransferase class I/II-fold pyridoxal phosphate-dependent enzyme [Gammaproteobacteria bacterium]|nr:aminotransferase class I/II-fold pyridoxal phosphate-dependent enzyme [Gammaproteobacteria bacterium]
MSDKSKITSAAEYSALGFYHKVTFLRSDTWIRLNRMTVRLVEKEAANADTTQLRGEIREALATLGFIEDYTAFPSKEDFQLLWRLFDDGEYLTLSRAVNRISRALSSDIYRNRPITMSRGQIEGEERDQEQEVLELHLDTTMVQTRPYFELLVVDDLSQKEEHVIRSSFRSAQRPEDQFSYDVIVVPSFQDAVAAVLLNPNIQACILRSGFRYESKRELAVFRRYLEEVCNIDVDNATSTDISVTLGRVICQLRPELDLYLITNMAVETYAAQSNECFRRIFYRETDYVERHLNIIRGINKRFDTPFFSALKRYSRQPTGVFHAMPISRAKSLMCSHWIRDMLEFYGLNVFLAETSATSGGLDSLSQPSGPLKTAQEYAARAFGARDTFFVTNGTSTANKIVVQALIKPGDIVLVDRDCHKSHHYGMVLAGADVAYLDAYPIDQYSMYGGVPLKHIKELLLKYKRNGKLNRVKMLLLTNCTFDGIVYDVERVMEECLAIKPDLVFLWDEAWFAFAAFHPIYRQRTAMCAAQTLRRKFRSAEYRAAYKDYLERTKKLDPEDIDAWLGIRMMPNPDIARVRTYATQSTHKTLTSLRQGSMIHVFDQDYRQMVQSAFHEAYMTHTSTSPNYQILASLDLGRRQVELEGYELVNKQLETAFALREQINSQPLLRKSMRVLTNADMVPAEYRPSGVDTYFDDETGWSRMEDAWLYSKDEFVIDPTRITLYIGEMGIDGDTFKNKYLMDKYGIQINKTSRNTVLFMTNIGTTRSSIAYLIEALLSISRELEWQQEELSPPERRLYSKRIKSLTQELPPLPHFSRFHDAFRLDSAGDTPEGDMRTAFFMGDDDDLCEHIRIDNGAMQRLMQGGREMVSKTFIIPYPPGFPILVPGQVISKEILEFMLKLDVKEIHGYRPELGLAVFTERALKAADDYGNESFPTKDVIEGDGSAVASTATAARGGKSSTRAARPSHPADATAPEAGAEKSGRSKDA